MHNLLHTLQDRDLSHLRAIAELWGIELPAGSSVEIATFLSESLSHPEFISEIGESLPESTRELLQLVIDRGGRVALADIVRKFGPIREMGPGRRDRDKPWRDPISPLEDLWYRGLCGKTFLDTAAGVQEYLYLPEEILKTQVSKAESEVQPLGHPAPVPGEVSFSEEVAVGDVPTLLAYLRKSPQGSLEDALTHLQEMANFFHRAESIPLLITLLIDTGVLDPSTLQPIPSETRMLLAAHSAQILRRLLTAWADSIQWNDLSKLQGLSTPNDDWPNDPVVSRKFILECLSNIPLGAWWDLDAFVADVHRTSPGFQRPGGDFDAWYLIRNEDGEFLQGFQHWDEIEGRLIRYLLTGPLHWLGAVDIGRGLESKRVIAFRLKSHFGHFLQGDLQAEEDPKTGTMSLLPDGIIRAPIDEDRRMRYQIARFTDWISFDGEEYTYRITPHSLGLAQAQGLNVEHIGSILQAGCENVPTAVSEALRRWDRKGIEASLEEKIILRVQDSELLKALLSNPRTAKYIQESLNPTTAIIHASSQHELYKAAVQTGLFIDLPSEE